MSSDEYARQHQDAMQLGHGRGAEAFLPSHEGRAVRNRERASRTGIPLLRWFYLRRAQNAERWAERCREEIAKAAQVKARRVG